MNETRLDHDREMENPVLSQRGPCRAAGSTCRGGPGGTSGCSPSRCGCCRRWGVRLFGIGRAMWCQANTQASWFCSALCSLQVLLEVCLLDTSTRNMAVFRFYMILLARSIPFPCESLGQKLNFQSFANTIDKCDRQSDLYIAGNVR